MENEEIKQQTPALESNTLMGQANLNQFYCWLCGEETFGAEFCPACGIPQ